MSPKLKLQLKLFLFAGVFFTIGIEGIDIIRGQADLYTIFFNFFWFGLLMSLCLTHLHVAGLRDLGIQELTDESLDTFQTASFNTDLQFAEIQEKLNEEKMFSNTALTKDGQTLEITTPISWLSFGEKIRLSLLENGSAQKRYTISSQSRIPGTLVDYGKNTQNIQKIKELILNKP